MRDCEMIDAEYPVVRCAAHPDKPARPGYSVCAHVAAGADIAEHYAPEAAMLGHVICARCADDETSGNKLRLLRVAGALELHCAYCVEYHLGARLPAAEVVDEGATVQ